MIAIFRDEFGRNTTLECAGAISVHGANTNVKKIRDEIGLDNNVDNPVKVNGIILIPLKDEVESAFIVCDNGDERVKEAFLSGGLELLDCRHADNAACWEFDHFSERGM